MAERLLSRMRRVMRARRYSRRTERAYLSWAKRFVEFHRLRHPEEMGDAEVEQYLSSLAVHGRVSIATQNQAAAALMFLYRKVLGRDLARPIHIIHGKGGRSLPVVLTGDEVRAVCGRLEGVYRLVAAALRKWSSAIGVFDATGEGYRPRATGDTGSAGEGGAGSGHDVPTAVG